MVGRTGRLACACACAICIPLLARAEGLGRAGALAVALEYAATRGCPDAGDFKAVVTRRLGYDPFRDDAIHQADYRFTRFCCRVVVFRLVDVAARQRIK